eukprot:scaffold30775_cov99-Isochrysis_galbana.AAC.1
MACLKALSGGSPMVPGACDQSGWALSRCLVGRLVCLLCFGWIGDQWFIGKPFPRASQWCQGRFLWMGRVLAVPWLSGRPMAHWKALSRGFPTVPGA